jgi:hypothetical protein
MGGPDVPILVFLRSAPKQDNQSIPILPEVNPISGAKINPAFVDAGADTLGIRKITLLDPEKRGPPPFDASLMGVHIFSC